MRIGLGISVSEPAPGLFAFYAGRDGVEDGAAMNWVVDGALSLGIASYAVVHGDEAIIYDSHVSIAHAAAIRAFLRQRGVSRMQVVLSHWHLDHVAGTEVFADCPIIANALTAAHLAAHRAAIEAGTFDGPPAIRPLLLPTETFSGSMVVSWGGRRAELHHFDIHSDDGTVLWLPETGTLLAGDTLEDTVTYVSEPQKLDVHLREIERLRRFGARKILPNHGAEGMIAAGGYDPSLFTATESYIGFLLGCRSGAASRDMALRDLLPRLDGHEVLQYFAPYERVHRQNVERVLSV